MNLQPILPVLFLALAGCGERPKSTTQPPPQPPPPVAQAPVQSPASSPARFVGRWAATEALCRDGAWRFRADGLSTAGEVSCTFDKVTPTPSGYDIDATCIAQAPPEKSVIRLTFAGAAKSMMVEGGPFSGAVGLIYCGIP